MKDEEDYREHYKIQKKVIAKIEEEHEAERKKWAEEKKELEERIKMMNTPPIVKRINNYVEREISKQIKSYKKDLIKKIEKMKVRGKIHHLPNNDNVVKFEDIINLIQSPNINNTGDCPLSKDVGDKVKGEKG